MHLRKLISGPSAAFRSCSANSGSRLAVARIVAVAQPTYVAAITRLPPTARIAQTSRCFVALSFSRDWGQEAARGRVSPRRENRVSERLDHVRASLTSFERATIF